MNSFSGLYRLFHPVYRPRLFSLLFGCSIVLSLALVFLTWKFYRYASYLEVSNAFYLKERNRMLERLATLYYTSSQIDVIVKKLGLSTSVIEKDFSPIFEKDSDQQEFLPKLDKTQKEQIAALFLLRYTPLEIGTAVLPMIFPKIEAKTRIALQNITTLQKLYNQFRLSLLSIPTILPTLGQLKSLFGYRQHPIEGEIRFHSGIDISNIPGTPIYAAGGGYIVFASRRGGYGNTVIIDHLPGLQTQYSHLQKIWVKNKEYVHRGQVIGYMGSTGFTTGSHLHYEVHVHNKPQDPLLFIIN